MVKRLLRHLFYNLLSYLTEKTDLYTLLNEKSTQANISELLSKINYCGYGIHINGKIDVSSPYYLFLGNNVHIGEGAFIKNDGGLIIGDNVHISRNLTIYTTNHDYQGKRLPYDETQIDKPVIIERNVWIGMNVNITPGVRIGEGSIVALGSTVSQDVPKLTVVGGNPAKMIKQRNVEHYQDLNNRNSFGGVSGKAINFQHFYKQGKELNNSIFFVASTGRAGSTTIAKFLSRHSNIVCKHEPNPTLIRLSYEYLKGLKSEESIINELKAVYYDLGVFKDDKIYGESDQKFGNLINPLSEILPSSKFIWLIRNGYSFVSSAYSRDWFSPNEYEKYERKDWLAASHHRKYRFDLDNEDWKNLDSFEKCCFYWSYWNGLIEQQLKGIRQERWIMVRLEDLESQHKKVIDFLGINEEYLKVSVDNAAIQPLKTPKQWSNVQHKTFENICGKHMEKWYNTAKYYLE